MKRPIQHLPTQFPKDHDPGPEFFYNNFVKYFIEDMIKMMDVGLYVDDKAVESLRETVDSVLERVDSILLKNKLVLKYLESKKEGLQKEHYSKHTKNVRNWEYYLKAYNSKMEHRTFLVNYYLSHLPQYIQYKWHISDLKILNKEFGDEFIEAIILNKGFTLQQNKIVNEAMVCLAEEKADLWNRPRYDKANSECKLEPFNPASDKQKKELFEMLDIAPVSFSKDTGQASWSRENIESVKKTLKEEGNEDIHEILQCLIDHSYTGIIKSNFIKAFDTYTIDDVMHGNIKLFGAKSFRNTSNSPNLLNAPSTGSIYAKPLKQCFVAPEGYLIYAIDLSALEDRVIANLSNDTNKLNVFLKGLDGHSLHSCYYYIDQVKEKLGDIDIIDMVKEFAKRVDNKEKFFEELRQDSKAVTFKLSYGGYPDDTKGGVITQQLFDRYHKELYPGISDYRENYVLKTAKEKGYVHLGLGCRIYTDEPDNDIRTLNNATVQFWSILTLIAINELNYQIKENNYSEDIAVCSSIYDSIYVYVKDDPEIIKWLDDTTVKCITTPYLIDEKVHNEAKGSIGSNWADLVTIPNNSSVEDITKILTEMRKPNE